MLVSHFTGGSLLRYSLYVSIVLKVSTRVPVSPVLLKFS
jgi:hypothetical protein